jgi:Rieske Fe-S protein
MVPPMQPEATPDRRTVVTAAVLGAGGLGSLTACTSSGGGGTSSTTAPTSAGPASSDGGATSSSSSGTAAQALVKLADVPVGGSVAAQGPGGPIVVAQPAAGKVVAFGAVCTHQGCQVQPQGARLACPCHGSAFDAFTGKALTGPAQASLTGVPVKISGQDVVAG